MAIGLRPNISSKSERKSPREGTTTNDADSLHFSIVLNGLSPETYACLSSHLPNMIREAKFIEDVEAAWKALEDMRYLSVPYVDPKNPNHRTKQPCFAVEAMPFAFAGTERDIAGDDFFKNWEKEAKRISSLKRGQSNEDTMIVDNEDASDHGEEDDHESMDFL